MVIDDEAAQVVRRIFIWSYQTKREIARILNDEQILTPALYKKRRGVQEIWVLMEISWMNNTMIAKIIRDERYTGIWWLIRSI